MDTSPTSSKAIAVYSFVVPSDEILRRNISTIGITFSSAVLSRTLAWFHLVVCGDGSSATWVLLSDGSFHPYNAQCNTQGLPVYTVEIDPCDGGNHHSLGLLPFIKKARSLKQMDDFYRLMAGFDLHGHVVSDEGRGRVVRLTLNDDLFWVDLDSLHLA